MTKLEIIDEVVAYYNKDITRRGFTDVCCYWSELKSNSGEHKICAVGYCLKNPIEFEKLTNGENIEDHFKDAKFKSEFKGHKLGFWVDLQELHDNLDYWNEKGITKEGLEKVKILKERYAT